MKRRAVLAAIPAIALSMSFLGHRASADDDDDEQEDRTTPLERAMRKALRELARSQGVKV